MKMDNYFSKTYLFYYMGYTAVAVVLSAECARKVKICFGDKVSYEIN